MESADTLRTIGLRSPHPVYTQLMVPTSAYQSMDTQGESVHLFFGVDTIDMRTQMMITFIRYHVLFPFMETLLIIISSYPIPQVNIIMKH